MFSSSIIIICFRISGWGCAMCIEDKNKIRKIILKASKITKSELEYFDSLYEKAVHMKSMYFKRKKKQAQLRAEADRQGV